MGWRERSTGDKFAIVGLVIGACIGVFFAVDANFLMRFVIIAVGAAIGFGLGRAVWAIAGRR